METEVLNADDLPKLFSAAEEHRRMVSERVTVETPDPFINAAVPALDIAADAIWDGQSQSFMHGAVAWRTRLLGWPRPLCAETPSAGTTARRHTLPAIPAGRIRIPIPDIIPPADEQFNLRAQ